MTQSRNLISPLGPSFMSQVRRHNPDAVGCFEHAGNPWPRCKASSENG